MRISRRFAAAAPIILAACVLRPQLVFGYDHPLTDEQVTKAYSIGQDTFHVNSFLAKYQKTPPLPDDGPHVAQIELSTPYAEVVEISAQHTVGYTEQQAVEDYHQRGDFLVVHIQVLFTPTYSADDDYWQSVSVGLIQNGKHMAAAKVDGQPIYSGDADGDSWPIGASLDAQFSIKGIKSDTIQVEVVPPGGTTMHATFDLSSLE